MRKGKAPPVPVRSRMTASEKLYKAVYGKKIQSDGEVWLNRNCLRCSWRNIEMLITAELVNEKVNWRHICLHPGPCQILALENRKQGGINCSGWKKDDGPGV